MLKKLSKLFLGLVVCTGSACVTPTHASSAIQDVIITHIQTSGEFGAKDEYVVIHNNSAVEVSITNWCLVNKSHDAFACLTPSVNETLDIFYLPPYGDAVVASSHHANLSGYPPATYTMTYEVTSQSSGSIISSNDTIILIDADGEVVDTKEWTTAIPTGKILARVLLMPGPVIYANTGAVADWAVQNRSPLPNSSVRVVTIPNPDFESQPDPTPDPEDFPDETNSLVPPIITEILANPSGADAGNEFIELYNPNEHDPISLNKYAFLIGANPAKLYSLPGDITIPPLGYVAISNQEVSYTLVNTSGQVQLANNGVGIGDIVVYVSPKDNYAWALIDGLWQYTKYATPGAINSQTSSDDTSTDVSVTSVVSAPKACANNQFRNPETGRCKLVGVASSAPVSCKQNQERNPVTNRCRNIATTTSPTPCKEGQERNPETNRCRAIVKMTKAGNGVVIQSQADTAVSWYYWAGMGVILLLILGYAVWEWRQELVNLWARMRTTFAKHPD